MKRLTIILFIITIAGLFAAASAQREMRFRGSEGWGINTRYEQLFDNSSVRAFTATVVRVDTITPMKEPAMGVAMRLIATIDGKEIPIHLGPFWYAVNQDINFPKGEKLEVRGCAANHQGSEFIMPVEMRSKNRIFRFRDEDGNPFWSVLRSR